MKLIISKNLFRIKLEIVLISILFCNGLSAVEWSKETLSRMTLEEKVGHLFVIPACQLRGEDHSLDLHNLITRYHVGGVILKEGSAHGQIKLTNRLQKLSSTPLLCVQDGEWGVAMRLTDVIAFPRNLTLGAIQNNSLLYRLGQEIGRQCRLVGSRLNLGPVVDVNCDSNNPIIHMRSFGEDSQNVSQKGLNMMLGMQSRGIMACAKHFPGHGDTIVDSHLNLPVILHSKDRLEKVEWVPFTELVFNGVEVVMSAHLSVPSIDSKLGSPATFSSELIQNSLRQEIGFDGLIITDALNMQAISRYFSPGEAAEKAYRAGHDLLLYGDHIAPNIDRILQELVPAAFAHLLELFRSGELSLEDLDRRILKILRAKEKLGLHVERFIKEDEQILHQLNNQEAYQLKKELFQGAVTVVQDEHDLLPLNSTEEKIALVGCGDIQKFNHTLRKTLPLDDFSFFPEEPLDLTEYKTVIVAIANITNPQDHFGITPSLREFLKKLKADDKQVVLAVLGSPYSLRELPYTDTVVVVGYERAGEAQEAAAEVIVGKLSAAGRLPVTCPPCE